MEIEKLIERLQNWDGIKPDREIDCAIEGLKALQAENDRLKKEVQQMRWIPVEERLPEPGSLIVYADVCIDEVAYGVLRVPQGKCHKVYNYWMCLSDRFNRRPPEEEI